ncbi:hypothetical protein J7L02_01450 [Candidatus Woesearchaeota archaeon]|nr:hypothetical protein [Candidatus Woesearchaeota archaeon]
MIALRFETIVQELNNKKFLQPCKELMLCKGFNKYLGLMFRRKQCAIIDLGKTMKPLMHNVFVFYDLKLFFFDENLKFVQEALLKPFRFYKCCKNVRYVLEVPSTWV